MLRQRDKDILKHIESYKAITIYQAYRMFYNSSKFGYDQAKKRLKDFEDLGLLKSYKEKITGQKVYYMEHQVSLHDLYVLDFYSNLHFVGCKNIEFIKTPRYLNGMIVPDSLFKFQFKDDLYFILLEVDFTHMTGMAKFQLYEKLFRENIIQKECYNTFPIIVVLSNSNSVRYESNNFDVIYMDFSMFDFNSKILSL